MGIVIVVAVSALLCRGLHRELRYWPAWASVFGTVFVAFAFSAAASPLPFPWSQPSKWLAYFRSEMKYASPVQFQPFLFYLGLILLIVGIVGGTPR